MKLFQISVSYMLSLEVLQLVFSNSVNEEIFMRVFIDVSCVISMLSHMLVQIILCIFRAIPEKNTWGGGGGGGGKALFFYPTTHGIQFPPTPTTHGIQFPPTPTTHVIRKFRTPTTHRIQFS